MTGQSSTGQSPTDLHRSLGPTAGRALHIGPWPLEMFACPLPRTIGVASGDIRRGMRFCRKQLANWLLFFGVRCRWSSLPHLQFVQPFFDRADFAREEPHLF